MESQWEYYCWYKKCTGVKVEVVCSFGTPRVVWMSSLFKGSVRDDTVAKNSILKILPQNESLLADSIYNKVGPQLQCAYPGKEWLLSREEKKYNYIFWSVRQSVERLILRLRHWTIFSAVWRFSMRLLEKCVRVCGKVTNFFLLFEPLG
jgi:DDE superfamily endonuclease